MPKLGDTLTTDITVIDNMSVGIEGLTFAPTANYYGWNPDNSPLDLSRVTWEELGDGVYRFHVQTYSPGDLHGRYTLQVNAPGPWPSSYTEGWDVDARFAYPVTGGTNRATLRRLILAKFGDLTILKATAAGTEFTLIDEQNLYHEPGAYRGREVIFTGGQAALRGIIRYIDASSRDISAVRFKSQLPVQTMVGDECEMCNTHGMGVTIQGVHNAIDYAVAMAQDYSLVPVAWTVPDAFNGLDVHAFTVPDELVGVESLMWQGPTNQWFDVERATHEGDPGWAMQHGRHSIAINGYVGGALRERNLIVNGYVLPTIPTNDTDEIHIDREWVVNTALAHLCNNMVLSRQASSDWAQKGQGYQSRADVLLTKLTPHIGPSFTRF